MLSSLRFGVSIAALLVATAATAAPLMIDEAVAASGVPFSALATTLPTTPFAFEPSQVLAATDISTVARISADAAATSVVTAPAPTWSPFAAVVNRRHADAAGLGAYLLLGGVLVLAGVTAGRLLVRQHPFGKKT